MVNKHASRILWFAGLCLGLGGCGLWNTVEPAPTQPGRAIARSVVLQTTNSIKALATACVDSAVLIDAAGDRKAAEELVTECSVVLNALKLPFGVAAQAVDNWAAEATQPDASAWAMVGCAALNLTKAAAYLTQQLHVQLPPVVTDILVVTNTALQYANPTCKVQAFTK